MVAAMAIVTARLAIVPIGIKKIGTNWNGNETDAGKKMLIACSKTISVHNTFEISQNELTLITKFKRVFTDDN